MGERPGPSHVPFIEVGGEAAMASGCPAGRLVARAGSRGGLGALRGGLMDLHVLPQGAGMRVGLVAHLAEIGLI